MKSSVLFFALTGCLIGFRAYSQKYIDFSVDNATLDEAITYLQVVGNCMIASNMAHTGFHGITFEMKHATVKEVLTRCLWGLPFHCKDTIVNGVQCFFLHWYRATELKGRVFTEENEELGVLSVHVLNSNIGTTTDRNGVFTLKDIPDTAILVITGISIQPRYVRPEGRYALDIMVRKRTVNLYPYIVWPTYHDGYCNVRSDIAPPGAWYQVKEATLNRQSSIDPLAPLNGQASGVLTGTGANNSLHLSIRGVSTLYAGVDPLVVVDNFPFSGDLRDINLNDIESITVLKDPVSSSLWGARSGNGVLVFTSKTGTLKGSRFSFNANTTVTGKPDLSYLPLMTPSDNIALEKLFFSRHFYDAALSNPAHPAIPPVVETLDRLQKGLILQDQADTLINGYARGDLRKDLSRWYYQPSVRQQYHFAWSGWNPVRQYYLSAGYDRDPTNLRRNDFQRYTLQGSIQQTWFSGRLQLSALGHYADILSRNNNTGALPVNYTYAALADASGKPLPVNYKYASGYIDTAGSGHLQDWAYRPLQELHLADNGTRIVDYYGQVTLRWRILPGLRAEGSYRIMKGRQNIDIRYDKDGFYVRDLTNLFTQSPDYHSLIPPGDILDRSRTTTIAHYLRGQFSFMRPDAGAKHLRYNINIGAERSEQAVHNETQRLYGYDRERGTSALVDPVNEYPTYITGDYLQIPANQGLQDLITRYLAYFANMDLSWKDRYSLYAALRKEGTNFVGVNINRKWSPFWAVGLGYDAGRRPVSSQDLPNSLRVRAGYGCNGNVGDRTGHLVTQQLAGNDYGMPQSGIANPPNPNLSWERTYMLNGGIDWGLLRNRLSPQGRLQGSLDIYSRRGVGLLGNDSLPPSSGLTSFFGNSAAMKGWGVDLVMNTDNIRGKFSWTTNLLLSYVSDRLTKYSLTSSSATDYVISNNPVVGKPLSALYSYRSAGLDPANGDPQGYAGGKVSKDYSAIVNAKGDTGIVFNGRSQPALFGGVTNTFTWNRWSISALVTIKAFYFFRRPSIDYYSLITGASAGHSDYARRWRSPGDEKKTSIPSPPSINDPYRSTFYTYSESTVTRGDYVRLQDIQLTYDLIKDTTRKAGARRITFYFNVGQVGLLWRKNNNGIDPEAFNYGALPTPRSYTLGVRMEF